MANRSYLLAVARPVVFPTLRGLKDVEVIASKDWGVGLLWFALFHPDEWKSWKTPAKKGQPATIFHAPLMRRRDAAVRLHSAADRLEKIVPKVKSWRSHLHLFQQAVDRLDARYKYLTCEWQEIAVLDPAGILDSLQWAVRFFAGGRVVRPAETLSQISGLKFNRPFLDPAKTSESEFGERDWKALDTLLGGAWKKDVPWMPRKVKRPKNQPNLDSLIDRKALKAIEKAIEQGAVVEPHHVWCATLSAPAAILRVLLEAGGSPNDKPSSVGSALVTAFHRREEVAEKVELLLNAGADVNQSGFARDRGEPIVLINCLSHGMQFAPRIVAATKAKLLQKFLDWSQTEDFTAFIESEKVTWGADFIKLVKKRLQQAQRNS